MKTTDNDSRHLNISPPNPLEAEALLAYLPIFAAEGFKPVDGRGAYPKTVYDFFMLLSQQVWMNQFHDYDPAGQGELVLGDLREVGDGLTFCLRAEHWGEGGWGWAISSGKVVKLLTRLQALLQT